MHQLHQPHEGAESFHEYFTQLRQLAGMPDQTDMWKGFRRSGVRVSPGTVSLWLKGSVVPTPRFRPDIQRIFDMPNDQFDMLHEGSMHHLAELALQNFENYAEKYGINDDQAIRLAKLIIEKN